MLSRRSFVTAVARALAGILAAACSGRSSTGPRAAVAPEPTLQASPTPPASPAPTPTATPSPTPAPPRISIWIDPTLPPPFARGAQEALATLQKTLGDARLDPATSPDEADVRVALTTTPADDAITVAREPLVVAVSPRLPVRAVSAEQARSLLSGATHDWAEVGSPTPRPAVPLPRDAPGSPAPDYEALVGEFASEPGGIALVPLSTVDFRVGTLVIDGLDPVRHPDQAEPYPFHRYLVVEGADSVSADDFGPPAQLLPDQAVTITMVGDIILGRTVHTIMTRLGDFTAPFHLVADELKAADLTVGDLECSLSDTIPPPTDPYTFSFMTRTAGVEGLRLAGIDAVSQANNHSMNFGEGGMVDTLAALEGVGTVPFGIGPDLATARAPAIFDIRGVRVAYLGYDGVTGNVYGATESSPGTAPMVLDYIVADIEQTRQQADLVIPFIHWGVEYTLTPSDEQRLIARRAIDAGAALVVGSHPHWVQGMEVYRGKPIVYSLGNFVFDQEWSLETKQGLILHLAFHGTRLAALRFVPVLVENYYRPRIVDGQEMTTILDRVWASTDELLAAPLE